MKKIRSESKGKPTIVKEHQKLGITMKSKSELASQLQVEIHKVFYMTKMDISKGLIEQDNNYLKSRIKRLSTQIEELMSKKYTNQNLQNQKIMKDVVENK